VIARAAAAVAVFAVIVLVVVGTRSAPGQAPLPTASLAVAPSGAASVVPASASPTPAPGAATIRARAAKVPSEFRYVVAGTGTPDGGVATFRVLLLDLDAAVAPTVGGATRAIEVASVRVPVPPGAQSAPAVAVSASADGHTVIVTALHPELRQTVFALDVGSGATRVLFDGPSFGSVIVSPDGASFAFARSTGGIGGDPAVEGLWVGATSGGGLRRIVASEPGRVGSPPTPVAFLAAGTALAFRASAGEGDYHIVRVGLGGGETRFDTSSGEVRFVGGDVRDLVRGIGLDPGDGRTLLVWSSRSLFGGDSFVATVDATSAAARELYRPGPNGTIQLAAWHPARDRYVVVESAMCCGLTIPRTVTVRRIDGSATKVSESPFILDVWWSRDGSRLFAVRGGDDSVASVADLLTSAEVLTYCVRGPGPPCP
jgi:hypothetical protein